MADVTLTELVSGQPLTSDLTGDEPFETVVGGISKGAILRQLSAIPINPQTGTSYSPGLTDQGKVITMDNGAANTVTIALNSSVAFPIGATLLIRQIGNGTTTLAATGGVTLQKKSSITLDISERYGQIVLHKIAVDTWHVTGEFLSL